MFKLIEFDFRRAVCGGTSLREMHVKPTYNVLIEGWQYRDESVHGECRRTRQKVGGTQTFCVGFKPRGSKRTPGTNRKAKVWTHFSV